MKRREFIKTTLASATGIALNRKSVWAEENTRKPNIIFVFADQMRSHVLGCYGNTQIATPNFNSLAAGGITFDNAISTCPVCSPFRAMLMSGLLPMHNHTVSNDTAMRRDVPTIAGLCKANGYSTGYIGKWHLEWKRTPFVPRQQRMGFDDLWASDNCLHDYFDSFYCQDSPERILMPGYQPEAQTKMAIKFIKKHRNQPFCLFMSWGPPHNPYIAPQTYMEDFPPTDIIYRPNVNERKMVDWLLKTDPTQLSPAQRKGRQVRRRILDNDPNLREKWMHGYYALSKSLDDCMGYLLKAIKEIGIEEDTILVFSSDHGDMMGSHRMGSKQMPFEESISIPFIVRYPRKITGGTRGETLLAPIDIMPTLLGLAGIKSPVVDGIDLSQAAMGKIGTEQEALLIMKLQAGGNPFLCNGVTPWRGVRTKRYTYARLNDRGPWLLFDNQEDPYQFNNQINDPAYAKIRRELDLQTNDLLKEADDPDDTASIDAFRQNLVEKSLPSAS